MIEKPNIKKTDKRDKHLPQNFEQLIEMYDLEKLWPYILQLCNYAEETAAVVGNKQPDGEEKIWFKKSENIIIPSKLSSTNGNTSISITGDNIVVTQVNADTSTNPTWKLQKYNASSFVSQINTFDNALGIMSGSFTKDNSFDKIRFGVNGSQVDTIVWYDVSDLENGKTYTISWRVLNITQGSFRFDNIQLQKGDNATAYESYNDKILVKNKNNIFDNFMSIESGSNTNGSWIKFPEGTMICRQVTSPVDVNYSTRDNVLYTVSSDRVLAFPESFISTDGLVINATARLKSSTYNNVIGDVTIKDYTNMMFSYRPFSSREAVITTQINYTAIGRWK